MDQRPAWKHRVRLVVKGSLMTILLPLIHRPTRRLLPVVAAMACGAMAGTVNASVSDDHHGAWGDPHGIRDPLDELATSTLVVSRISYGDLVVQGAAGPETYPLIFNDPAISGIQGKIHLDLLLAIPHTPRLESLTLPATGAVPITSSFSSKSEGALLASADGRFLTYMGYEAAAGLQGVSNSYTPGANLAGNLAPTYNREVARISRDGDVVLQPETNAYSGDNPRGAITVDGSQFYMAGNCDNTLTTVTPPTGPGTTIGARYGTLGSDTSIQLGVYSETDAGKESASKHIKDNNFRGLGIFNGNLYVSKGSGGNGDDGVFQVGTGLPTTTGQTITPLFELPATDPTTGNNCIYTPFGFWFANDHTMYVADEGNPPASAPTGNFTPDPLAGLEKWSLVTSGGTSTWVLDYTIQDGLDLGVGENLSGFPVPTYTYGLRTLTGKHNADGTVTLFAVTAQDSSISGGEPDPTKVVAVTDILAARTLPVHAEARFPHHEGHLERFVTLHTSGFGEVYRGIALAPHGFLHSPWCFLGDG
jgi:hypothetical protein